MAAAVVVLVVVLCLITGCCCLRVQRRRANTCVLDAVRRHTQERRASVVTVSNTSFTPTVGSITTGDRDDTRQSMLPPIDAADGTGDVDDIGAGTSPRPLARTGDYVADGVVTVSRPNSAVVYAVPMAIQSQHAHTESTAAPTYGEPLTAAYDAASNINPTYSGARTTAYETSGHLQDLPVQLAEHAGYVTVDGSSGGVTSLHGFVSTDVDA